MMLDDDKNNRGKPMEQRSALRIITWGMAAFEALQGPWKIFKQTNVRTTQIQKDASVAEKKV